PLSQTKRETPHTHTHSRTERERDTAHTHTHTHLLGQRERDTAHTHTDTHTALLSHWNRVCVGLSHWREAHPRTHMSLERVPVFGPNRPSRGPGCHALEFLAAPP